MTISLAGKRILFACGCLAVSYAACEAAFLYAIQDLESIRNARTEFAFHWSAGFVLPVLLLVGSATFERQRFMVYALLAFLFSAILAPVTAWSGPGDLFQAIEPLIGVKQFLPVVLIVLDGLLLFVCARIWPWLGHPKPAKSRSRVAHA